MNIGPVIKAKTGHNRYCGPGALSIITGIDTAQAAAALREVSGRKAIKGAHEVHMRRVLTKLGYRVQTVTFPEGTTLAAWLKANPLSQRGTKVYLITVAHHYVTVQGRRGGCNLTGGPVALKDMKKRRGVVASILLVSKQAKPEPVQRVAGVKPKPPAKLQPLKTVAAAEASLAKARIAADAALARLRAEELRLAATKKWVAEQRERDRKNAAARARKKAKALAATWGIRLDPERYDGYTNYWVLPPDGVYADDDSDDPCRGDHIRSDWEEILDLVQTYADDLAKRSLKVGEFLPGGFPLADAIQAAKERA
jgi:hypothetical protein